MTVVVNNNIKHGWYTPKSKKIYIYKDINGNKVKVSTVTSDYKNPYSDKMKYFEGSESYVGEVTQFISSYDNKILNKLFK